MPRPTYRLLPCTLQRSLIVLAFFLLQVTSAATPTPATPTPTPATIYQQQCASCHGIDGRGVPDKYEGPLYGSDSVAELTQRIAETMPEDNPQACQGDEARQVAEYIYQEFYSEEARLAKGLITAPRIELARLTVSQYRNAVADLLAACVETPDRGRKILQQTATGQPGLEAFYFQSKKMSKTDQQKMKRIDTRIDFDFAAESPGAGIAADQFAIIWQGSVWARDTGYYDFRIQTPNGARLYLNANQIARHDKLRDDSSAAIQSRLIDGWVSSGEMRTLTGRMFLLGGRRYPIRVDFFKYHDPTASIRLEWKPPHSVWTVPDDQVLSSANAPRTFVIETPFPADDRSLGYERGSSISAQWHNAITHAALATADEVVDQLASLTSTHSVYVPKPGEDKEVAAKKAYELAQRAKKTHNVKLPDLNARLANFAFRRPLTQAENHQYRKTLFQASTSETAVRRAVLRVLTSPHFLYTDLTPAGTPPSAHTVAARLAFALWDSLPDAQLRRAADKDQLQTQAEIAAQAKRMLADPRARTKMRGFFRHWLELEGRDLSKDQQLYPDFDEAVIADLRRSLELFVEQVVWSDSSDYRELLRADYLLLNHRLQQLYASTINHAENQATGNHFERINSSSEGRSGILTHPYLLSAFAYHDNTSPIHRGVFLTRNIVGRQLKPPPIAVAFENNHFAPHLTMREKVTELTSDQACLSCHEVINPLGFALENFDAVGRWRTQDQKKPIDTRSNYTSATGTTLTIDSPGDIANFAVASPIAQRAFITQVFQHLSGQNPAAYGSQVVEALRHDFVADDFHIKKLLVNIASRTASYHPSPAHPEERSQP